MSFSYSISYSDANNLASSDIDTSLVNDLTQALNLWSNYITGLGSLVVSLNIMDTAVGRADASPTALHFVGQSGLYSIWEPAALYQFTNGQHIPGSTSDITINVDPDYFKDLDLSQNLTLSSSVRSNSLNPIVVFLHELEHGFGMNGFYNQAGTLVGDGKTKSSYDLDINMNSSGTFFVGPAAEAVFGGPVPLTSTSTTQNYYHFGNSSTEPLASDLMNGISFKFGFPYTISPLDVAVLKDIGYNVSIPSVVGSITVAAVQNDYLAITRTQLSISQATTITNDINTGKQTETAFVNSLLNQVTNTTIPAVAVEASMYGAVGTSDEVTALATQFLPPQVANALSHGYNPQVYASEALGLVFAFNNENGSTGFANNFGPSHAGTSNTVAGDAAFAAAASTTIFGTASTAILVNAIQGYVANWKAFYTGNGIPGIAHPTTDQIDLAARGAAWGDAVGLALANNLGPIPSQVTNFLIDAAQGKATYSTSLASQPAHGPFQSAPPTTPLLSDAVGLTGVAASLDHLTMGA